jgi:3-isopropylmalate/(R)-2-methylmalate dehydratase small subunit
MNFKGNVFVFGDHVNTDEIIPARYLNTTDVDELARHCMEGIRPDFTRKAGSGGMIIVAGENFGCGSSREHAPIAIKGTGILCIIAQSFARIFLRNSINIGLPIVELINTSGFKENDRVEVNFMDGTVNNRTSGRKNFFTPYPEFMQEIIQAGGWLEYAKIHHDPNKLDNSHDITQFSYNIKNISF